MEGVLSLNGLSLFSELMSKSYYEKLKDPRWQKVRLEVLQRDSFTCVICSDDKSTLNVHHTYYLKGFNPWEYPSESLKTLCESCHKILSDSKKLLDLSVSELSPSTINAITGFLCSIMAVNSESELVEILQKIETDPTINMCRKEDYEPESTI